MSGSFWAWVALAALALGSVCNALHMSIRDLSRAALEQLCARRGRPRATARARAIAGDLRGHAAAMSLPRIAMNLLVVVAAVRWITHLRGESMVGWLDVVLGLVLSAVTIWVLGTLLPLSIARHASARVVYAWAPVIRAVYLATSPASRLVTWLDEVVRRLVGANGTDGEETRDELISVIEEGEREGQFDETERDMIEAVVEFRTTDVRSIMTPRTEIEALEYTDDLAQVKRRVREIHHSRIPVYRENLDHIVGILYAKDLLRWMTRDESAVSARPDSAFSLRAILRPATFVPETKTVRELLTELLAHRVHLAMVADEFGGTAGLVTIEDIIEEVFGEIHDEFEEATSAPGVVVDEATRTAEVDGRWPIDDANDALRAIGLELPESEEYDTVAGLVVTLLGHIPVRGETLRLAGTNGPAGAGGEALRLTVLEAEPTRVGRVRVEVDHAADEEAPAERAGRDVHDADPVARSGGP